MSADGKRPHQREKVRHYLLKAYGETMTGSPAVARQCARPP